MHARALIVCGALALAAFAAFACTSSDGSSTGGSSGTQCPQDLPAACPTPTPSFAGEVDPIIVRRCGGCHLDGGVAQPTRDFTTYDDIFRQRSPILNQVYSCNMPPPDAGQPTPEERAALLGWLVCKAPNN
jgi:hypothetical protein